MIKVAALQAFPLGNPREKLEHALTLMEKAHNREVDIACFPETYPGSGEEAICRKAKDLGLYVIAGLPEIIDKSTFNTSTLISSDGFVSGRQRKIHLEAFENEIDLTPGRDNPVFDTKFGVRIGITVCIDGWGWPEQTTSLAHDGADIVFNTLYGISIIKYEQNAALVRAYENLMPLVFVRTAKHQTSIRVGSVTFPKAGGGSMIICPPFPIHSLEDYHRTYAPDDDDLDSWIVAEADKEETILTAEIDPAIYRDSRRWWLEKRRRLNDKRY